MGRILLTTIALLYGIAAMFLAVAMLTTDANAFDALAGLLGIIATAQAGGFLALLWIRQRK